MLMWETFSQAGVVALPQILDRKVADSLAAQIRERIVLLMQGHGCKKEADYFAVINRWPLASLLPPPDISVILKNIRRKIFLGLSARLTILAIDVIYKSNVVALSTPVHQDISYAWQNPYDFSTWIALSDVSKEDSALQFLPGSHHDAPRAAVDFWQPHFSDSFRNTSAWQQGVVTLPAQAGNGFLFSSRILHASCPHYSKKERFALVIRWKHPAFSLNIAIPPPQTVSFGMWNCGEITNQLLQKSLELFYGYKTNTLDSAISTWLDKLRHPDPLPFLCNRRSAIHALKKLHLLQAAHQAYQGGDGQGIVYALVWNALLLPLKKAGL